MNDKRPSEIIEGDLFEQNSLSRNAIKERINKRQKGQEIAGNYLLKIYNSLEKNNQDAYLAEREKQEQKKKLEYEMADKARKMKIDDFKRKFKNRKEEKEKKR